MVQGEDKHNVTHVESLCSHQANDWCGRQMRGACSSHKCVARISAGMLLGLVMVVIFIIPVSAAVFRVPDDSPSIQKVPLNSARRRHGACCPRHILRKPDHATRGTPSWPARCHTRWQSDVQSSGAPCLVSITRPFSGSVIRRGQQQDFPESGYSDDSQQCHY